MLKDQEIFDVTNHCIDMWHTLDVEKTLSTYTDDVIYSDPGLNGDEIHGKEALRRYLTKFFKVWSMKFNVVEERRIAGMDAQLCRWVAEIRHLGGGPTIEIPGMDIVEVRGDQVSRDQAFMNMVPLLPLREQYS